MVTVLVPYIGYDAAAKIAHEAYHSGKTIRQIALEKKFLSEDKLNEVLNPINQTGQ